MYRRIPLSIEVKKVLKLLMYTLLALLFTSSAYFFIKMSLSEEKGYLLRENQFRQNQLEFENRLLKQRVLEAQSLKVLRKSDVVEEMMQSPSSIYVKPKGPLTKKIKN